jgi:hypothetical protein
MSNEVDLRKQRKVEATVVMGDVVNVKPILADNASETNIPASLIEVLLQSSNSLRRELVIHNNSNGVLYVLCGTGVTDTNYSYKLSRQDTCVIDTYRGQVNAIGTSAIGFYMITEKYY